MSVRITTEYLRKKMQQLREQHQVDKLMHGADDSKHLGIVPDMINEILRLRGEAIEEFPWQSFPAFKLDS